MNKIENFKFIKNSLVLICGLLIVSGIIASIVIYSAAINPEKQVKQIVKEGKKAKTNLEKFKSINVDLKAAGINKADLQEEFKKDPLRCRVSVDRHVRKRFLLITNKQEQEISKQIIDNIEKEEILFKDKKVEERCNAILERLTKSVPKGFTPPKRIYIIDTPEINACCLPDGTIILFRGLVEKFNDNELAWIMAHELGHGTARHAAETLSTSMIQDLAMEKILDKESSVIKVTGTELVRFFANLKYSRIQEDEADRLGLYYANKAGYDMDGAINVLKFFKSQSGKNTKLDEWLSTHPLPENRLKNVEAAKAQLKDNPDQTWGGSKEEMIEAGKVKAIQYYMKMKKNPDQTLGEMKEDAIKAGKAKARQYYMKKKK